MKHKIVASQRAGFFTDFCSAVQTQLSSLKDDDGAPLFVGGEPQSIVTHLSSVHNILQHSCGIPLGEEGRDSPSEAALNLIKSAPTLLGVKPVTCFRIPERNIGGLSSLRVIERESVDGVGARIHVRTKKIVAGGQQLVNRDHMVFVFHMQQFKAAAEGVGDPAIAGKLDGIRQALDGYREDLAISSFTSMWDSKEAAVLYGFPETAVKDAMALPPGEALERMVCSRWLDVAIACTPESSKPVQQRVDRFDATAELMGDYLREVWGEPIDFKDVWRRLEGEHRGDRISPPITRL